MSNNYIYITLILIGIDNENTLTKITYVQHVHPKEH